MSALLLALALGCADDGGLDSGTAALCADAPVVTWESWGHGFMIEACQSCHASSSADRNGAPWAVQFDTEADVWEHRDSILARSTGDSPTMPPAGGVDEEDRQRLEIWLRCWLEEP